MAASARVGRAAVVVSEARAGSTYEIGVNIVKHGDTLPRIAQRHGLRRIDELRQLNPELADSPLVVAQHIRVCQRLKD